MVVVVVVQFVFVRNALVHYCPFLCRHRNISEYHRRHDNLTSNQAVDEVLQVEAVMEAFRCRVQRRVHCR